MGSARVEYELERTLPALQLAVQHGIYDKDAEVRAITDKRRRFENNLVRRHAVVHDYERYLDYEQKLFALLQMRVKRISKVEEIPKADVYTLLNQAKSHIISIFERGVKRLRHDLQLWLRYMRWAMQQKMRSAVSRISANALALFPGNVSLWLSVADYELNQNGNVTTARALLLRAIRLNNISHSHSIDAAVKQRPSKRARRSAEEASTSDQQEPVRPTGIRKEDVPALDVANNVQEVVHLWLQYIRMELVFLEKMRRRQIVLNIAEDPKAAAKADAEAEGQEDAEGEAMGGSDESNAVSSIAQIAAEEKSVTQEPADSIVLGAIPIAAMKSAISLDSTISLPPKAHFGFLLALADLFSSFPFYGNASGITNALFDALVLLARQRYPRDAIALILGGVLPLFNENQQSQAENISEAASRDELENSPRLQSFSRLQIYHTFDQEHQDTLDAIFSQIERNFSSIKQHSLSASLIRRHLESVRTSLAGIDALTDADILAQVRLVQKYQRFARDQEMGEQFESFLEAYLKRVWKDVERLNADEAVMSQTKALRDLRSAMKQNDSTAILRRAVQLYRLGQGQGYTLGLQVAIEHITNAVQTGQLDREASRHTWYTALSKYKETDVTLWRVWRECLASMCDGQDDEERELEKALQAQSGDVASIPVANFLVQEILQTLRGTSIEVAGLVKKLEQLEQYTNRIGPLGATLLRQIIADAKAIRSDRLHTDDDKDCQPLTEYIATAHAHLAERTDSWKDHADSLRFQCVELGRVQEAVQCYAKVSRTFAKTAPEALPMLEKQWQAILQTLRSDDVSSDEEEADDDQ